MKKGQGERLFTQKELEKHIAARLTRKSRQDAELTDVKNMVLSLMEDGTLNADSCAEACVRLCEKLRREKAENRMAEQNEAEKIVGSKDSGEYCEAYGEASQGSKLYDGGIFEQTDDCSNSGDESMASVSDEQLHRLCTELTKTLGLFLKKNDEGMADVDGKAYRRAASTGFSANSALPSSDAGVELSAMQRDIARRAGLSYREYANLLKDIPQAGRTGKFSR